jgi:hypothetical protein
MGQFTGVGDRLFLTMSVPIWYKTYGFNTEQEFEAWCSKYGKKLKLWWPSVSPGNYSSYEEYLQRAEIDAIKAGFRSPSSRLFGRSLKITTTDGKSWTFNLEWQNQAGAWADSHGIFGLSPVEALYSLCWLASSPLVSSIEALDISIYTGYPNLLDASYYGLLWIWIMTGKIPLTITQIPNVSWSNHPPLVPPPMLPASMSSTQPAGTTTPSTSQPSGTTAAVTSIQTILPYAAIGAGVILLLWAMTK